MVDERKKHDDALGQEQLLEDQLEEVAGGFIERFPNVPLEEVKPPTKFLPTDEKDSERR